MHRSFRLSLVCSSLLLGATLTADVAGQTKTPSTPAISTVYGARPGWSPTGYPVYPAIPIKVVGKNFGVSQGKQRLVVELDGKRIPLPVTSWSDTAIATKMPSPQDLGIWNRTGSQAAKFYLEGKAAGEKDYSRVGGLYKGTIAWHDKNDQDGDGVRGYAGGGDDCDEADPKRAPGFAEIADFLGHDEDCDPNTFGTLDHDGDGRTDARVFNVDGKRGDDCDDTRAEVHIGQIEACNHRDDNCNGLVDEELLNCPH